MLTGAVSYTWTPLPSCIPPVADNHEGSLMKEAHGVDYLEDDVDSGQRVRAPCKACEISAGLQSWAPASKSKRLKKLVVSQMMRQEARRGPSLFLTE